MAPRPVPRGVQLQKHSEAQRRYSEKKKSERQFRDAQLNAQTLPIPSSSGDHESLSHASNPQGILSSVENPAESSSSISNLPVTSQISSPPVRRRTRSSSARLSSLPLLLTLSTTLIGRRYTLCLVACVLGSEI